MAGVPLEPAATYVPVAAYSELREGYVEIFEAGDVTVGMGLVDGEVFAVAGICTHAQFELGPGLLRKGGLIECPMHMAMFDPRDGSVCKGPAEENLKRYDTEIRDGIVHVAVT
jgi:3-phenylpropionate/trans-cinnamate dioxygenase ferredoxin component